MPIENLRSILANGILSFEKASEIKHCSVALEGVQTKRDAKQVPGGLRLHQYANLYFHARNPMMYKRQEQASKLCVLRISKLVLQIAKVVLADRNAACDWARFLAPHQWRHLDFNKIYAANWNDTDHFEYYGKKAKKCAEVLVPHKIPPEYLTGAYVVNEAVIADMEKLSFHLPITVDPWLFFR